MRLPSATKAVGSLLGLPPAGTSISPTSGALIEQILARACPVALNLSLLADGRYRATVITKDGSQWLKGHGHTADTALNELKGKLP